MNAAADVFDLADQRSRRVAGWKHGDIADVFDVDQLMSGGGRAHASQQWAPAPLIALAQPNAMLLSLAIPTISPRFP